MDRILYTAMSGAARTLEHQAVISNNLANVNTSGFRQQLAIYRAVPVVAPDGLPTRVSSATATQASHFGQGVLTETGRALDVAITGPGWLAVQTPQGEAYTRAGDLAVNAANQLVTQTGLPVLSADGAPMELPDRASITFGRDGNITALGAGDNPRDIQPMGQIKLVNPPADQLVRGDDGLFRLAGGGAAPADPDVRLVPGFVEKSNASPAEMMVSMITNARRFEMQMQVIRGADTNAERANSILSAGS